MTQFFNAAWSRLRGRELVEPPQSPQPGVRTSAMRRIAPFVRDVPAGCERFDERLSRIPERWRPADGGPVVRIGSTEHEAIKRAFAELGDEGLSEEAIRAVLVRGEHPERFAALMVLVRMGLLVVARAPDTRRRPRGPAGVDLLREMAELGIGDQRSRRVVPLQERFEALAAAGVRLGACDARGLTPLHIAATVDNHAVVRALVAAGASLDARCERGMTPLNYAAQHTALEAMRALLEAGAKPNLAASAGEQFAPLHWSAVTRVGGVAGIRMLIEHGADPMIQTRLGRTPLHLATQHRQFRNAKLLLDHGADPNVADQGGATPLHRACYSRDPEAISLLLENRANPNLDDGNGQQPLYIALQRMLNIETLRELLLAGANVNAQSRVRRANGFYGWGQRELHRPALHFACDCEFSMPHVSISRAALDAYLLEAAELLLEFGADPNQPDLVTGDRPLHAAVRFDASAVVDLLIRRGRARVEVANLKGQRPIDIAAELGYRGLYNRLSEVSSGPPVFTVRAFSSEVRNF